MNAQVVKLAIRTILQRTSKEKALAQAENYLAQYRALCDSIPDDAGRHRVSVPPMSGVDEEMRDWSLYQLLEHNAVVNRCISATVVQLSQSIPLSGAALTDPKHGVMPTDNPGPAARDAFFLSVKEHIDKVTPLKKLKGTATTRHPLFGEFDAHRWNGMFSLHLKVHLPQTRYIVEHVSAS